MDRREEDPESPVTSLSHQINTLLACFPSKSVVPARAHISMFLKPLSFGCVSCQLRRRKRSVASRASPQHRESTLVPKEIARRYVSLSLTAEGCKCTLQQKF